LNIKEDKNVTQKMGTQHYMNLSGLTQAFLDRKGARFSKKEEITFNTAAILAPGVRNGSRCREELFAG
jgi:hypothetical protein